jgi:excisionase family DNA binding protein
MTAHTTTLPEIRELATLPVYAEDAPNVAGLLGLTRWHVYKMAQDGELPVLRLGGRILVPVPALRRMLGDLEPQPSSAIPD